jgi:hypothetical protein
MQAESAGATQYDSYVAGSKDPFGRTIRTVVGRHRHMVVYVADDPAVCWNYDEMPERLRPAVTEFQVLNGLSRSCLSKKVQEAAVALMASALYAALLTPEGLDPKSAFTDARAYTLRKSTGRARLYYVLLSLLFTFCFLSLRASTLPSRRAAAPWLQSACRVAWLGPRFQLFKGAGSFRLTPSTLFLCGRAGFCPRRAGSSLRSCSRSPE